MLAGAVAGAFDRCRGDSSDSCHGWTGSGNHGRLRRGGWAVECSRSVKGLSTIFNLPEPTTGALVAGSFNVYINRPQCDARR